METSTLRLTSRLPQRQKVKERCNISTWRILIDFLYWLYIVYTRIYIKSNPPKKDSISFDFNVFYVISPHWFLDNEFYHECACSSWQKFTIYLFLFLSTRRHFFGIGTLLHLGHVRWIFLTPRQHSGGRLSLGSINAIAWKVSSPLQDYCNSLRVT